ncbi:MAG: hypothetical protein R2792_12970 [Saprospiraceae bacterium]
MKTQNVLTLLLILLSTQMLFSQTLLPKEGYSLISTEHPLKWVRINVDCSELQLEGTSQTCIFPYRGLGSESMQIVELADSNAFEPGSSIQHVEIVQMEDASWIWIDNQALVPLKEDVDFYSKNSLTKLGATQTSHRGNQVYDYQGRPSVTLNLETVRPEDLENIQILPVSPIRKE